MSTEKAEIRVQVFVSFGEALRYYREHISERIRRYVPGRLPDIQLTAKDVVACMKDSSYSISQAAYSDIEQSRYLPKDPELFFEAVTPCLALERGSPEYQNLMDHLLFDVLKQKFGEHAAAQYRKEILALRNVQLTEIDSA